MSWSQLLFDSSALPAALAKATLDATNVSVEFPLFHYGVRCGRVRATISDKQVIAESCELRTLIGDDEFFAATSFRTTRYHLLIPRCQITGLDYASLLNGTSYHAESINLIQPSFDALVNRDAPVDPHEPPPQMVHQALAAIPAPLRIDFLNITNGYITYRERVVAGAAPGVLTFGDLNLSITNIANRIEHGSTIQLAGQAELMKEGLLKVQMSVPIAPTNLAFHYSGSLNAMDLTRLGAFLDIAEHTRIKSGLAHEVTFDITVSNATAEGHVRAIYDNLVVAVLDKKSGTEDGLGNRVASLLVNTLKIEKSNGPDASGVTKEGKVKYTKKPKDTFLQFAWFALRGGVLDAINQ